LLERVNRDHMPEKRPVRLGHINDRQARRVLHLVKRRVLQQPDLFTTGRSFRIARQLDRDKSLTNDVANFWMAKYVVRKSLVFASAVRVIEPNQNLNAAPLRLIESLVIIGGPLDLGTILPADLGRKNCCHDSTNGDKFKMNRM